jgi:membrane fusion protein (multidrug efflux system)
MWWGRVPNRFGLLAGALAVLLVASGCDKGSKPPPPTQAEGLAGNGGPPQEKLAVEVGTLGRQEMHSLYSTSARLRPRRQATVTARTRGVVYELTVEEGDRVDKGQILARLEDDEQAIDLDKSRAALDTKRREFVRIEKLHSQLLVSDEEYEALRRELDQLQHETALAELKLERTRIRAPFAGTILHRHIDAGATLSDGTPVFDLADLDPMEVDVNVPERHVPRLKVGQPVRLRGDANGLQVAARIERIAPSVDTSTGTVKVTLAVEQAGDLRPGAFVRVDVVTDTHPDALVVPRTALVAEGRHWNLYRLASDGDKGDKVEQLRVELGFENGAKVEIDPHSAAEHGLDAGTRVVVVGAAALSDGAAVQIVEPQS